MKAVIRRVREKRRVARKTKPAKMHPLDVRNKGETIAGIISKVAKMRMKKAP